jgi:hypothetical protein
MTDNLRKKTFYIPELSGVKALARAQEIQGNCETSFHWFHTTVSSLHNQFDI